MEVYAGLKRWWLECLICTANVSTEKRKMIFGLEAASEALDGEDVTVGRSILLLIVKFSNISHQE